MKRILLPVLLFFAASGCQCVFRSAKANDSGCPHLSLDREYVLKMGEGCIDYGFAACPLNKQFLHIDHSRFAGCRIRDRDTGAIFSLEDIGQGYYKLSYLEGGSFSLPSIEFRVQK